MQGGSFETRPIAARPALWSLAWTASVAVVGFAVGQSVPPALLLALAVMVGLPHGAADLDAGRSAFRSCGRAWWQPFLLVYLGLVGLTLAAWAIAPFATLGAFLLLAAYHFGEQDAAGSPVADWLAALAHGGAVIVVPTIAHPQAVEQIFAVLVGADAPTLTRLIAEPIAAAWLAIVAAQAWRNTRNGSWRASVDLVLVTMLFAAAPPLVAFALYFAFLHTPRALMDQYQRGRRPVRPGPMAGLTALACLLGLAIFLAGHTLTIEAGVVRTSFLLLSALTVPHMALEQFGRATLQRNNR